KAASLLESQAARMNAQLAGIEKGFGRMGGVAQTVIAGLAAKLSVDAVRGAVAFGASIKEMSENWSMATDEAQQFTYAIQKGGATTEQAAGFIDHFTKTVGDAARGSGEA